MCSSDLAGERAHASITIELQPRYDLLDLQLDLPIIDLGAVHAARYHIEDGLIASRCDFLDCKGKAENAIHENFLIMDHVHEHLREMNPMILYDLQKFHPTAYEKFVAHKNTFMKQEVADNIRQGIGEGLYRPDIRVDIISKFRVDSIYLTFSPDFLNGTDFSLVELQQELAVHFMYGIASFKGHQLISQYRAERLDKTFVSPLPQVGKTGS